MLCRDCPHWTPQDKGDLSAFDPERYRACGRLKTAEQETLTAADYGCMEAMDEPAHA